MANVELARKIYRALEKRQFDMDRAGFIEVITATLNAELPPAAAGKERIEITKEACAALRSFLMNDREGTCEGYSDFIFKAIELRRNKARMKG